MGFYSQSTRFTDQQCLVSNPDGRFVAEVY